MGETANGSSSRTAFWEPRNNDRTFPRPPLFRELGSDARELVSVVAFFPQGVNEENTDWLFPTVSGGPNIFGKFCILSLAYRTNGFVTMLAPLRDYLHHKDPTSSLLRATKERYFSRLSAVVHPDSPGFDESRWIISEDVNVEHLLDIFTSIDANSEGVWDLCARFVIHLYWHKPRLITLGPKIEALPDDFPSKMQCLENLVVIQLGRKFGGIQTDPHSHLGTLERAGGRLSGCSDIGFLIRYESGYGPLQRREITSR